MNESTNTIIREFLVNQSTLTDVVGQRVFAPRLPENTDLPALSFFTRGGVSTPYIPGIVTPSVQFDCWADTPQGANEVYRALYHVLQGIQNQTVTLDSEWVSPISYRDPGSEWNNESNAYDDDVSTFTLSDAIIGETWGDYLELNLSSAISCDAVRFYSSYSASGISQIDLDVYYEGAWHDIYQGVFADREWVTKTFTVKNVLKARVRYYCAAVPPIGTFAAVYEFDFQQTPSYQIMSAIEEVQGQDLVDIEIPNYFRTLSFFSIMIMVE